MQLFLQHLWLFLVQRSLSCTQLAAIFNWMTSVGLTSCPLIRFWLVVVRDSCISNDLLRVINSLELVLASCDDRAVVTFFFGVFNLGQVDFTIRIGVSRLAIRKYSFLDWVSALGVNCSRLSFPWLRSWGSLGDIFGSKLNKWQSTELNITQALWIDKGRWVYALVVVADWGIQTINLLCIQIGFFNFLEVWRAKQAGNVIQNKAVALVDNSTSWSALATADSYWSVFRLNTAEFKFAHVGSLQDVVEALLKSVFFDKAL